MGMSRAQKEAEIKELNERFSSEELVVVTHYSGLTVSEISDFRAQLREEGATYKVTKNALAKLAIAGTQFEGLSDLFTGPTGVATSTDPVAAAKVAHKFAKTNKNLIIVGGALGDKVLDIQGIEALAKMPSLDEVRATIVALIMAPGSKIASVINTPGSKIAGAVKAVGEKAE